MSYFNFVLLQQNGSMASFCNVEVYITVVLTSCDKLALPCNVLQVR